MEATLSMILKMVLKPLLVDYVMLSLNVASVDSSFEYFTGVARMALDYQSYSTNISVFPSIYLIGNFPVKST